ncbi:MAG: hypothetical protein O2779_05600 [Nanoarchaeota archaeon]|nr:hypothetical protein [Nanoarchaeota archaeon]
MADEPLEEIVAKERGRTRRIVDFGKRNAIRLYRFGKRNVDYALSDGIGIRAGWGGALLATEAMIMLMPLTGRMSL